MTYEELNARQYALAYAIAGGDDLPGLLDTVSTEDLVGLIRAERAQARDTQDALVAYSAAEAREAALREAAKIAQSWKDCGHDFDVEDEILALIK